MATKENSNLAKILGVEEDATWRYPRIKGLFRIHSGVREFWANTHGYGGWFPCNNEQDLTIIISCPEDIIPSPMLTEPELAICKAVGAKWVSRDKESDSVDLWGVKPIKERGFYKVNGEYPIATVRDDLFPSVKPGDCICAEEAGE